MLFTNLLVAFGSAVALGAAVPSGPTTSSVTHSGNGCPQNSKFEVASSGTQFKLYDFEARGPGIDTRTQNCGLHFEVSGTPGWQVSIQHVAVLAHGYFPQGEGLSYYLTNFLTENAANTGTVKGSWTNSGGQVNGPVVVEMEIPSSERIWSQCGSGGILNPNFRAAIDNKGYFGTRGDTITTKTITYEWREC